MLVKRVPTIPYYVVNISKNYFPMWCYNIYIVYIIYMLSYKYRDPHVKDKKVSQSSYLLHGNPYTLERWFLYWDGAQIALSHDKLTLGKTKPKPSSLLHSYFTADWLFNTLRLRQNGRHFADDSFICIFLNENVSVSIKISLKFDPKGPNNNIPALVQIMAWRRPGDKPLSEAMMVSFPTHICVTLPQWVKLSIYN